MTIYVNDRNEIHDVGSTTNPDLTPVEVTDGSLDDMSEALICCYKVNVVDGNVQMRTPYVPSSVLESIQRLGKGIEAVTPTTLTKTAYIDDTEVVFDAEGNITAYMVDNKGNSVPFTMTQADGKVRIAFDKLDTTATVTINII